MNYPNSLFEKYTFAINQTNSKVSRLLYKMIFQNINRRKIENQTRKKGLIKVI